MINDIGDKLGEIIKEAGSRADTETLKKDIPLSEQGVDSLDMANILLNIEESFNLKIPDEDVNKLNTITNIVHYIKNRQKEQ